MTKDFNGYFTDRNMEVLGLVSTTNPNALKIVFDEEQDSIDKGVTTFAAEVSKHFGLSGGNTTPDLSIIKAGNYFLYEGVDGIAKVFTIIDVTSDSPDEIVSFYAEDGGLDIINEIVGDYEAKDAMVISKYFDLFLKNTGFKIGINELGTTYSRKLKWDGEASVTERLRSVAHQFDHAEINFSFKVKGMRVTQKHVNIYKKRGEETGITLELNRHVNRITATETIANLATSLSPKGSVPENKKDPITLKGHKYDDGRFFVENGFLRDRESNETWSRFLSEGRGAVGGYINKPYTYDTTNVVTLRNSAITELKKVSQVAKNFEVDIAVLPDEVRIGDTINIVNQKGELYLEARVLQLTRSRVEDKAVAVLGDYLIKESGINEKLFELSEQMKNIPQGDSSYLWIRYADDDKGTGFSASPVNKSYMAVKTVINQPIPSDNVEDYEGLWLLIQGEGVPGEPGKDGEPTYTWIRYADNVSGGGISANPEGKMYIGFAHNKPTPEPSDIPKDYAWSAMYDEAKMLELQEQLNGMNYVGTNLWAPNFYESKGNVGAIDINTGVPNTNANYIYTDRIALNGAKSITRTVFEIPTPTLSRVSFYKTDSDTSYITFANINMSTPGPVTVDIPPEANYIRFFKSRQDGKVKVELGNKATDYSISPLDTPTTGDLSNVQTELQQQLGSIVVPVMQPNRPTPKEGMVWWKTDVTGDVIGIEKYVGGKWEKQVIQQETLNIINLNAVKITGSEITGTEIAGSTLVSAFDNSVVQGSPIRRRGTLTLAKGYALIKYEQYDENSPDIVINKGESRMDEYGISTILRDKNDNELVSSQYGPLGININDRSKAYGSVNLGYNDLVAINETAFTSNMYKPGFTQYDTSPSGQPRYSRNNRLVQLSGAIRNNVVVSGGVMAVLPVEVRPERIIRIVSQGSSMNRYMMTIESNGEISAKRYGTTSPIDIPVGSWLNIACAFVAGN